MSSSTGSTRQVLSNQWSNPSDIFSFLLIIGGDVVQNALAQFAGLTLVPVCFSFGWVAYAFNLMISMTAEGRLMPDCDYPCKVINLENGYARDCHSWLLGRFLVGDVTRTQRETMRKMSISAAPAQAAIHINVYDWRERGDLPSRVDWRLLWTVPVLLTQLGIAAIPWGLWDDWGPFLITGLGTILSCLTGYLPQWNAERFSCRTGSDGNFAITQGNGSAHVAIVRSLGVGLNFEDLASGRGPLMGSTWDKSKVFSTPGQSGGGGGGNGPVRRHAWLFRGVPVGLWITRLASSLLFLAWVALLITATGLTEHKWFLLCVGALGMLQNAVIAGSACLPQHRGMELSLQSSFRGAKVMDTLMDLELIHEGYGRTLRSEFFPGEQPAESAWWNGDRTDYDANRTKQQAWRGLPGSSQMRQP